MLTIEEFNTLEKHHQELLDLSSEQNKIMDTISNSKGFKWLWDSIITNKYRNARKLAWKYLEEAENLYYSLWNE
jgi:hypothetical protein